MWPQSKMAAAAPVAEAEESHLPPLFPFLFFGCWNQPGNASNDPEKLPRNKVFNHIRAHKSEIQTIIIGGDNVYPRPERKVDKYHEPDVFDEGFGMYASLGKPIVLAFGNHNESTLDHQKARAGFRPEDSTYFVRAYAEGVDVVVLDTNKMNDAEMLAWFDKTVKQISESGREYYVVQHEPYFTAKKKKFGSLVNGAAFLEVMFTYRQPISVLCADTHHYQHAEIKRIGAANDDPVIHQFIVGTGGANYDEHKSDFESRDFESGYTFKKIEETSGFGYLCVDGADLRDVRFEKVSDWPAAAGAGAGACAGGGGKTRTRRQGRRQGRRGKRTRRSSK
jgi:hypothetical protein